MAWQILVLSTKPRGKTTRLNIFIKNIFPHAVTKIRYSQTPNTDIRSIVTQVPKVQPMVSTQGLGVVGFSIVL